MTSQVSKTLLSKCKHHFKKLSIHELIIYLETHSSNSRVTTNCLRNLPVYANSHSSQLFLPVNTTYMNVSTENELQRNYPVYTKTQQYSLRHYLS